MDVRKQFNEELYAANDEKARTAGKLYWRNKGHKVIDNPNKYGADLIVDDSFYCEVEVKNVWSGAVFPWGSVQLPHRKEKFTKLDKPCLFIIFNKELTHGILFKDTDVLKSNVVEVPNKFINKNELFYQIETSNTEYITINQMRIVLDIETNSTHDEIWLAVTRDIDNDKVTRFRGRDALQDLINRADKIITHNGIFFDFPVLKKQWNITVKKSQVIDTLVLSRLYNPSLEDGHSLAAWGQRLGFPKGDFKDFDGGLTDEMIKYCEQDTSVTKQLYLHLEKEMKDDFSEKSKELEHQVAIIIAEQERNGFKLDEKGATQLLCSLKAKLEAIKVEMESIFPPRVESGRTHKKTGKALPDIVTPFNPGSRQQIAERLQEKGWKPKKHTEKGSVIVDETTLEGINIPEAKAIAEYLMLQKRIAQIESWLSAVESDGRVHGRVITSGAITFRATHMSPNMAQVPASKKPYGHECRALWTVEEGNVLVGCDLSGIELRCFAHYLKDEEYSYAICEGKSELGTDVHTRNQKAFGCQTRDQAKTILYATLYGASPGKVGTIIGGTERDGKRIIDNFTKSVPAFKQLKDRIKAFTKNGKIQGLGGYTVQVRSEHSSLNTLLQSAGAIIAKQWIVEFTVQLRKKKIPYKLVGWIHDEVQIETKPEYAEELGNIVVESAKKAGELLNFRVPVGAEFKVGKNWSHTH